MALPKQSTPVYQLVIPSTGKKVSYRPFLVKDEKSLLIANQSRDPDIMIATLKSVIESCVTTKIDVDSLSLFDIEYLFCKLRAKSVGEIIEVFLKCSACNEKNLYELDISTVEVKKEPEHKKKFVLFDNVGVSMKYPDYTLLKKLKDFNLEDINKVDSILSIIIECIEYIYDNTQIYYAHETSSEELMEFVNNLTKTQLLSIIEFFNTMPRVSKDINYKCHNCGHDNTLTLEGIQNFF